MRKLILGVVAGLFLSGGIATAASHYLITSTHQIKPSVLAQIKGKQGPQGVQGAAGAPGATGPQGSLGPQGIPGTAAAKGDPGPAGPQGLQGPQGPKGDKGAQGDPSTVPGKDGINGVSGWEEVTSPNTNTPGTATATCSAGNKVLGGGFTSTAGVTIQSNGPNAQNNATGWTVTTAGGTGTFQAYALCAKMG